MKTPLEHDYVSLELYNLKHNISFTIKDKIIGKFCLNNIKFK